MTMTTAPFTRFASPLGANEPELSIVMPCLNEADTIAICIEKAQRAISANGINGEIVIADNGSTDGSQEIARKLGARVVAVDQRGYGAALMGGIAGCARHVRHDGRRGRQLRLGARSRASSPSCAKATSWCRDAAFAGGGGTVKPGAMPFLHRWWGNPMFTALARWWFRTPIHDVYCGMRAFSRGHVGLARSALHRNGVRHGDDHQGEPLPGEDRPRFRSRSRRTGARRIRRISRRSAMVGGTLRFFLLFSPRWLFLMPGLALILAGTVGYALAMPRLSIGR